MSSLKKIGLFGNPNCGKTTLFNSLTGLRQKTGNFPGVTVDKKIGSLKIQGEDYQLVDFPGTYSLYPGSKDEQVVLRGLSEDQSRPDLIVYVADVNNLNRHLLLFSQLRDCGIPIVLLLNMIDLLDDSNEEINSSLLSKEFKCPVLEVSSRTGEGLDALRELIVQPSTFEHNTLSTYKLPEAIAKFKKSVQPTETVKSDYLYFQEFHHSSWLSVQEHHDAVEKCKEELGYDALDVQLKDTMSRYDAFEKVIEKAINKKDSSKWERLTDRLDGILMHNIFGPIVFILLMMLVFQAIFAWASYPMDLIDGAFGDLSAFLGDTLPEHWLSSLLVDGVIPGIGGVVIFIPQIAILFLLISILEEIGYMSRVAYLFDRLMQYFGLNGRSLVAMISSAACAIPAVMSTRTISNWKERMITIMVAPLISCSARIPVYALLVGFVVPNETVWGVFNMQGLAFGGLYLLGIVGALLSALMMKYIIKSAHKSYLLLEMPTYKVPDLRNAGLTVLEKVRTFVWEAGKVIFVISIVLWGLSSYGPKEDMLAVNAEVEALAKSETLPAEELANIEANKKLEASYVGHIGKFIEPVIEPLGFDWKMGIALVTSFAAREVFVGTMATLYAVGDAEDGATLRSKMERAINPKTGKPLYSIATAWSLLLFYVFAMQCMSTLAVVKRETKSWKWPMIQFTYMTLMAYFSSLIAYTLLS